MPTPLRSVDPRPETARERAARLDRDAAGAVMAIVDDLMAAAKLLVTECEDLPDRVPAGLRDELRRMGRDMGSRLDTAAAIRGRA